MLYICLIIVAGFFIPEVHEIWVESDHRRIKCKSCLQQVRRQGMCMLRSLIKEKKDTIAN